MPLICALDPSKKSCEHDRIEPMWSVDIEEETGFEGPYVLVTGAYKAKELYALAPNRIALLIEDLRTNVQYHEEQIARFDKDGYSADGSAANACERLHLAHYQHDLEILYAAQTYIVTNAVAR